MRFYTEINSITGEVTEIPMPHSYEEVVSELKRVRDIHWTKGVLVSPETRIQSDQETISNISGAIQMGKILEENGEKFSITWSVGKGDFIDLDLKSLMNIGAALYFHAQQCVNRYKELYERLKSGENPDLVMEDINSGWPA